MERSPSAAEGRESVLLLRAVLDTDEARLRASPEAEVTAADRRRFEDLVRRRAAGEPVAYLLGEREFFGRDFAVDPRVLIPRPESEHLIELAMAAGLPRGARILDLGTGSGCLAVTLAGELPGARVVAVDRWLSPLAMATVNVRRHGAGDRVSLVAADWASAIDISNFDLVVANPPYLSEADWQACDIDVRGFEPRRALVACDDGLAAYRRLTSTFRRLKNGCRVALEIGAGQGPQVAAMCERDLGNVAIHRDLSGLDRVVVGTRVL